MLQYAFHADPIPKSEPARTSDGWWRLSRTRVTETDVAIASGKNTISSRKSDVLLRVLFPVDVSWVVIW